LDIIGKVKETFITISDMWAPRPDLDMSKDNVFITKSMDPTSHFEGETENVLELYKKITGNEVDLENLPDDAEDM